MRVSTRTARSHIRFDVAEYKGRFTVDTEWRLTSKRNGNGVGNEWFDTPEEAVYAAAQELALDWRWLIEESEDERLISEAVRLLTWLDSIAGGRIPRKLDLEDFSQIFPIAGESVDGLTVRPLMLAGVREVSFSLFPHATPPARPCSRTTALVSKIRNSGEVDPLFVVIDDDGPYVLEGAHRFDALLLLGKKSFPAKVLVA